MRSPSFPDFIQQNEELAGPPTCTICHESPTGGLGTATTAFATYLRSRGLRAGDTASLANALAAATAEGHDSDGDGASDIAALEAGRDPNGEGADAPPPVFGCGTAWHGRSPLLAIALVLGVLLRRRRAFERRR